MIRINIEGPGLIVNRSAAVVFKALKDAGYDVNMDEFAGQSPDGDWMEREIDYNGQEGVKVDVHVDPLPWGG